MIKGNEKVEFGRCFKRNKQEYEPCRNSILEKPIFTSSNQDYDAPEDSQIEYINQPFLQLPPRAKNFQVLLLLCI